jgi:hypothetical protein
VTGSTYARFTNFAYSARTVWQYLRTLWTPQRQRYIGHNPIGGWAIFFLLSLAAALVITGFATQGGEERQGLFAHIFSFETGLYMHQWHQWLAWMLLTLVGIHVLGVIVESFLHHENLTQAMFSGYKIIPDAIPAVPAHRFWGGLLLSSILIAALYDFKGYWFNPTSYLPIHGIPIPQNTVWNTECGSCHLSYTPTLLPSRSWQALLANQHDHFDNDLSLDAKTQEQLWIFAQSLAADKHINESAWRIDRSIAAQETPLRITDTPYWQAKYRQVPYGKTKKSDCAACHKDAMQGSFEDSAMRYPTNF